MKSDFESAFTYTIGLEGKYTNDPLDPGGPTNWGITQKEASEAGFTGDIKDLPIEWAKKIYKANYWDKLNLDECESQVVANKFFDTAVNCGVNTAAMWMQRALNALSKNDGQSQPLWPLLNVDGLFGPISMSALNQCCAKSPEYKYALLKTFNCLQGASYVVDTEKNPRLRNFFFGWISKRVQL